MIALQDGIGTGGPPDPRHCTVETIPDWLAPLLNAIRNIRPTTELWADVELYVEVVSDRRFPASLDRIRQQLAAEAQYVSKMTSFCFSHFMSPKQFFGEYKKYVDEI